MKRILITRARSQAHDFAEKLSKAGFEPIFFPVIEIQPIENNTALEGALSKLTSYDWVIFTSANGVNIVFDTYSRLLTRAREGVKFAAVGPATAKVLQAYGVTPDFVPQEYVAKAILPGLGDVAGKWVLLPRAELGRKELSEAIFQAGGIPHEIVVYRTLPAQPSLESIAALRRGVDVIALTSSSTVRNFIAIVRQHELDPLALPGNPLFACIGPFTEQTAREEGLIHLMTAKEHTAKGLIEVITSCA